MTATTSSKSVKVTADSAKTANKFIPLSIEALEGMKAGECSAFLVPSAKSLSLD